MRVLLLAAGSGTRLAPYTRDLPKGMLSINGRSLLERQVLLYRSLGFNEIAVVTGYRADAIRLPNVTKIHNANFAKTNMVHSLICARDFIKGGCVVSYSDLLIGRKLIEAVAASTDEIGVVVDSDWRSYWCDRFGHTEDDLESLEVGNGRIVSLGAKVNSSLGLQHRYVGVLRLGELGVECLLSHFDRRSIDSGPWSPSGKPFLMGYMTDLLNEVAEAGHLVRAIEVSGGWMEFDTARDYEMSLVPGALASRMLKLLAELDDVSRT